MCRLPVRASQAEAPGRRGPQILVPEESAMELDARMPDGMEGLACHRCMNPLLVAPSQERAWTCLELKHSSRSAQCACASKSSNLGRGHTPLACRETCLSRVPFLLFNGQLARLSGLTGDCFTSRLVSRDRFHPTSYANQPQLTDHRWKAKEQNEGCHRTGRGWGKLTSFLPEPVSLPQKAKKK